MNYEEDVSEEHREPGPEVTRKLFRRWQKAVRGSSVAEDMTNPVWLWLFRGRVDPYHANERFKSRLGSFIGGGDYPSEPRWAGCRMGQSRTGLSDGRVFWVAGEHEDYYDPDFFIYNDVIIEHPDGDVQIIGYPESSFRPTDFHSATAIDNDQAILLIGNVGYADERDVGKTQIYSLDTKSLVFREIASSGDVPGWISKHESRLAEDSSSIVVRGGEVMTNDGLIENIDDWSLSLSSYVWTRLTKRNWVRFQVSRSDEQGLHLWQYDMRKFALEYPRAGVDREDELAEQIGGEPNMDAFNGLYHPPIDHSMVERNPDDDSDWRAIRVLVGDVCVRYNDDMEFLMVTVEGELPASVIESIAGDVQRKLSLVENIECRIKWLE